MTINKRNRQRERERERQTHTERGREIARQRLRENRYKSAGVPLSR